MRVVCLLLSPGVDIQHLAECCLRFSPQVAIGEHWIFLEIGKCQKIYSEETVIRRLRVMLQRFGLFGQLSVANDLPTSLAFARYKTKSKNTLPVRALTDYLNPFGYSDAITKMLLQLDKLGIYTIEDFINIPRQTLVTRFGKEGLFAAQRLLEADKILWPHFKVQEKIFERLAVSTAPDAIEALLFYVKTLSDRVAARLVGRGKRVSKFVLRIHQEKFSHVSKPIREFLFELPLAQSVGVSLLSIIRERLSVSLSREPFQSEVESIELHVLDTIPLKTSQKDFLNRNEEEREAWASLISRLDEKLGKNSVFVAQPVSSYLPEKSWRRSMKEELKQSLDSPQGRNSQFQRPSEDVLIVSTLSQVPPRPLRVFKKPVSIKREGSKLCATGENQGMQWEIESVEGPERIREEWWNLGSERDYYKVQTRHGEKLWIFQRDGLFLHGLFD